MANRCFGGSKSGSTANIEAVARAVCTKVLGGEDTRDAKLAVEVEMYWPVVAAELEAGIIDETGEYFGEPDWTRKMEAYRDWMRRHPESREAWEVARYGAPLPRG